MAPRAGHDHPCGGHLSSSSRPLCPVTVEAKSQGAAGVVVTPLKHLSVPFVTPEETELRL